MLFDFQLTERKKLNGNTEWYSFSVGIIFFNIYQKAKVLPPLQKKRLGNQIVTFLSNCSTNQKQQKKDLVIINSKKFPPRLCFWECLSWFTYNRKKN